jgi:monovalent cation/hydrogen antiporter
VQSDDDQRDALQRAAAQTKAASAAAARLDEVLADQRPGSRVHAAADILRGWNERRQRSAWESLGRGPDEIGEAPSAAFKRLRLEMLAAERESFIEERDAGRISDEVLRSALHGLDLEEATLNRD